MRQGASLEKREIHVGLHSPVKDTGEPLLGRPAVVVHTAAVAEVRLENALADATATSATARQAPVSIEVMEKPLIHFDYAPYDGQDVPREPPESALELARQPDKMDTGVQAACTASAFVAHADPSYGQPYHRCVGFGGPAFVRVSYPSTRIVVLEDAREGTALRAKATLLTVLMNLDSPPASVVAFSLSQELVFSAALVRPGAGAGGDTQVVVELALRGSGVVRRAWFWCCAFCCGWVSKRFL